MSRRSFWGWGYVERFPERETRMRLGQLAAGLLGGAALDPGDPPALEAIDMPEPRLEIPPELAAIATADRYERARRTYGKGYRDLVRGFAGDFRPAPDVIARPTTEQHVEAVLEWADRERVAVIPYGGGSSVVGGVEADVGDGYNGVVSLDLTGIDRVLEVDDVSLSARIGAGALGPVLEEQLAAGGHTLRCFPQSFEFSTLGGWIATRAGGHFATVYTHIDDLVQSTRAITPRGLWQTRRLPASGAGPAPDRLMIGSEGSLGVITEAWVRIRPRPTFRSSASVGFAEWSAAVDAVRELSQSRLYPANCRLLDSREAMIHQVAFDGANILILGFESASGSTRESMERALAIAARAGGTLRGEAQHRESGDRAAGTGAVRKGPRAPAAPNKHDAAETWRKAFIDTPYQFNALVSLGLVVDTFETAVTWDQFDALHAAIKQAALTTMRDRTGAGLLSCRFTHVYPDGPAPYYTFITTALRGEALEVHAAVKAAVSDALIEHGATITHHHAVGRLHRPWYRRERPELFGQALAAVKRELDPAGLMNPGVLI